jgi:hypothetical protein
MVGIHCRFEEGTILGGEAPAFGETRRQLAFSPDLKSSGLLVVVHQFQNASLKGFAPE